MLKRHLRSFVVRAARALGSDLRDSETGNVIGRALLLPWRGRILVIGLETPVIPHFAAQKRLTYWKQELQFRAAPVPDFPHER